jgi:hypothetical protein
LPESERVIPSYSHCISLKSIPNLLRDKFLKKQNKVDQKQLINLDMKI